MMHAFLVSLALFAAHDGPDPVLAYPLLSSDVVGSQLRSQIGPAIDLADPLFFVPEDEGGGSELQPDDRLTIANDIAELADVLPTREMTVSAWLSVMVPQRWGGVLSCVQDNGESEQGWVLGYNNQHFTFALATTGADDGDGYLTYLTGKTRYDEGQVYQVVATYDGTTARLYVNGQLDAETTAQSGDILYPDKAPVMLGSYADDNEFHPHHGRLMDVRLYDMAAGADWVADQFEHHAARVDLPVRKAEEVPISDDLDWQVQPFLQYATRDSIRIVFETTRPVMGAVRFGPDENFGREVPIQETSMLCEVMLEGLEPGEPYFYQVSLIDDKEQELETEVLTFQTAAPRHTPIAFAILSDTQDNPTVASQLAEYIWGQRPGFIIHPGDLTGTGSEKTDWTHEFFTGNMAALLSRVTVYPVLGNHEQDARHYYRYFSLPEPEYYYAFSQGDADFFMIDTNRDVSPGSEQYVWLDQALGESDAIWKFVVHHHPPYSSDDNDYGDTWVGQGTRGDLRVRVLSTLYDKHGVDLVMNGHIHSYERTWPIEGGRVTDDRGVVYTITGGGGGGLEVPSPTRPAFNNTVRQGHHYCMVRINGRTLEFFVYDLENRLFDHMKIDKRED